MNYSILKALSIICCIFSSTTFAGGAWIADQNGCKVWNGSPQIEENITWSGSCVDGYANGKGILQWYKSGIPGNKYEGEYVKGNKNGKGTLYYQNGDRYNGDFVNDKRSGKGKFVFANGNRYEGDFVNGIFSGKGEFVSFDGLKYKGDFLAGNFSGKGTYTLPDGRRYEGDFLDGKFSGKGIYTYPSGSRKEGDFVNDVMEGQCKYIWKSGSQFNGTCKNNEFYNGTEVDADGSVTIFVNGIKQRSTSASSSTAASSGHMYGTVFKALVGAVVAVKTGDSTLLNQATQDANRPISSMQNSNNNVGIIENAEILSGNITNSKTVGQPVTNCVGQVIREPKYQGDLSGTKGITNNCNFPISVRWCVDGRIINAAGLYVDNPDTSLCSAHYLGQYSLEPKEVKSLGINSFDTLRVIACKVPYRGLHEKWNGNKFSAECIYSPLD